MKKTNLFYVLLVFVCLLIAVPSVLSLGGGGEAEGTTSEGGSFGGSEQSPGGDSFDVENPNNFQTYSDVFSAAPTVPGHEHQTVVDDPKFSPDIIDQENPIITVPVVTITEVSGGGPDGTPEAQMDSLPYGWLDDVNANTIHGWTCDANDFTKPIDVHFYMDGPAGSGTGIAAVTANMEREQAVGNECGGERNHGFMFQTPDILKDGKAHTIFAYAINFGGTDNPELSGSPKVFQFTFQAPTASISQSKDSTMPGEQFDISWSSTNADSCKVTKEILERPDIMTDDFKNWGTGTSGSRTAAPGVVGTHKWNIQCTGPGGMAQASLLHTITQAPNSLPIGFFDGVDNNVMAGWACDPSDFNQLIDVHFYMDGPAGSGTGIAAVTANMEREQAVGNQCGGNRKHGFSFMTPNALKDGKTHTIFAYAINTPSDPLNNPLLAGSPKTFMFNMPATPSGPDTPSPPVVVLSAPPTLNIPDRNVDENEGFLNNLVDLFAHAADDVTAVANLVFNFVSQSAPNIISCSLDSGRFIDCTTQKDKSGFSDITISVRDADGQTTMDTFRINVLPEDNPLSQTRDIIHLNSIAFDNEFPRPGDDLGVYVRFDNNGEDNLRDVRLTAIIQELGIRSNTINADVKDGKEESKRLMLEIPEDAEPGRYWVEVVVDIDGNRRIKYRPIDII